MISSFTMELSVKKTGLKNPVAKFYRSSSDSATTSIIIARAERLGESITSPELPLLPSLNELTSSVTKVPLLKMRRSGAETAQDFTVSSDTLVSHIREIQLIEMNIESSPKSQPAQNSGTTDAANSSNSGTEPMEIDSPMEVDSPVISIMDLVDNLINFMC